MSARDWSREPYRKLFLRPSTGFMCLPVLVQGLAYVLMRLADDDGRIKVGPDRSKAIATLCKMAGADPRERRLISDRIEELLSDGMLRHEGDFFVLPNLPWMNRRRSSTGHGADADHVPTERPANLDQASTRPRPSVERASSERDPSVESASSLQRASTERDLSSRNHSADLDQPSRARARSQVGRQVGRKGDQEGSKRQLPPAPDDHPVTELITANEALVFGASPAVLAAGVIALAGTRSEDEQVEATGFALETVKLKLSTSGLDNPVDYFGSVVRNLLAPGGLEAERASREPLSANRAARSAGAPRSTTGSGIDLDAQRARMRQQRAAGDDE